jgi:transposase
MAAECPRCGARRSWLLRDGRRRCARCRLDWRPGRLPLRLSRTEWRVLISWFVRGAPSAQIATETGLERKRVLRALAILREAMLRASPGGRRGMEPESDLRRPEPRATRRPTRQTILGIYLVDGAAGADLLTNEDLEDISRMLRTGGTGELTVPRTLEEYAAVVIRGRLHRLPRPGLARAPFGQIDAFWAYLQRHLRTKGGIRTSRLNLYLAEYAWRYNHRRRTASEQVALLMKLVGSVTRWAGWDYAPRSGDGGPGLYPHTAPYKH